MEKIKITCKTKKSLDYKDIRTFQGEVKTHNEQEVKHIITSILQNGFSFPIFIWQHGDDCNCLDGHGRLLALTELERKGYEIPAIPVVYIEADDEREARRKLVEVNNLNGDFVESAFTELVADLNLDLLDFNIPGLDLEKIDRQLRLGAELEDSVVEESEQEQGRKKSVVCPACQFEFEVEVD